MFRRSGLLALALVTGLMIGGSGGAAPARPAFQPPHIAGAKPWTGPPIDDAPDSFRFAVVTDLYSGYRPGVFDVAVAELGLLRPAFVMTIGDQIEGGIEDKAKLNAEWDEFDARLAGLHAPYFHAAGNHDMASLAQREVFEARYGRRYYHFLYKNVLFLVLDTEDYTPARMSEIFKLRDDYIRTDKTDHAKARALPYATLMEAKVGEIGDAQSAYFEKVLKANPKVRWTVLLFHKPVWNRTDAHGLGRIEAALKGRPYTVVSGHLHQYGYASRNGHDYLTLGTTGGGRKYDGTPGAVDHVLWVTMTKDGPSIANLRLDGVFDKTGHIPAGGENLCLDTGPKCPAMGG
ncbi:MAG: metallophosphoesterase [Proteobacteria bacterium]|nr:metallophosphoesterase [Pseudomonadota bacterium]